MDPKAAPSLEAVSITKRFGKFTALDRVSLKVASGSVHALLGENGAGKSTLVKCIMGYHAPDDGDVLLDGFRAEIPSPQRAQVLGLGMVYQHFTLVPSLTGLENLIASQGKPGIALHRRRERGKIQTLLEKLGFDVPLDLPVSRISSGQKQKLEIVKQLYLGSTFLILDEPTSVLAPNEADEVLSTVRKLADENAVTVLMISHKFREVMAYTDSVTVLRRGTLVGHRKTKDTTQAELSRMMIGEVVDGFDPSQCRENLSRSEALTVADLRVTGSEGGIVLNVPRLEVRHGEIIGVAGVSGNGQRELFECLSGQVQSDAGAITLSGKPMAYDRESLRQNGIRFLPEEPLINAVCADMSVTENLALSWFDRTRGGVGRWFPSSPRMRQRAAQQIAEFNISTRTLDSPAGELSGGNVQRMVLARELTGPTKFLVVANPCFGLDFRSAAAIRQRLIQARADGAAILLLSEDLDELLELSDGIAVMSDGHLTQLTQGQSSDRTAIGRLMAGDTRDVAVSTAQKADAK